MRPDYVLVRRYWLEEAGAFAAEAGLHGNVTLNGTNLISLENGSTIPGLTLVHSNNDTLIYRYMAGVGK